MITLPDHDAIELAELLDWLNAYFNTTTADIKTNFNTWAAGPDALHELTLDLDSWANLLRTTTPT
jgi:hypothetical protein